MEELFEARKPKGQAIMADIDGTVRITESKGARKAVITGEDGTEKRTTSRTAPASGCGTAPGCRAPATA